MQRLKEIIDTVIILSKNIAEKYNIPEKFISISENAGNSISVWITELTTGKKSKHAFAVSLKGKKDFKYVSFLVKKTVIDNITIPKNAMLKSIESDIFNVRVNFPIEENDFTSFINDLLNYTVNTFEPSDKFGCCDKYIECSNAKKCLHNNLFYAKACYYRKNLESGKIFYGENKNI